MAIVCLAGSWFGVCCVCCVLAWAVCGPGCLCVLCRPPLCALALLLLLFGQLRLEPLREVIIDVVIVPVLRQGTLQNRNEHILRQHQERPTGAAGNGQVRQA